MSKKKIAGITLGAVLVVAAGIYVFATPYNRIAGVRLGGDATPAPADWSAVNDDNIIQLKVGGFPPFVVNVVYVGTPRGVITATRPDGGYWAQRARDNPDGWLRIHDAAYAVRGTEIVEDAERIRLLEAYAAKHRMSMEVPMSGGVIQGTAEPLRTWEVFLWTAR